MLFPLIEWIAALKDETKTPCAKQLSVEHPTDRSIGSGSGRQRIGERYLFQGSGLPDEFFAGKERKKKTCGYGSFTAT